MAPTVEECKEIVRLVKETGLTYLMGETCYYYPCAMYCREAYEAGKFGDFVYGASQYYHTGTGKGVAGNDDHIFRVAVFHHFKGSGSGQCGRKRRKKQNQLFHFNLPFPLIKRPGSLRSPEMRLGGNTFNFLFRVVAHV